MKNIIYSNCILHKNENVSTSITSNSNRMFLKQLIQLIGALKIVNAKLYPKLYVSVHTYYIQTHTSISFKLCQKKYFKLFAIIIYGSMITFTLNDLYLSCTFLFRFLIKQNYRRQWFKTFAVDSNNLFNKIYHSCKNRFS